LLTKKVTPEDFADQWHKATIDILGKNGVKIPNS
jgi:hypothetical protein